MRGVLLCAVASVVVYLLSFGFLLDRPLTLGWLRLAIDQKTARLATLPSPKLVIIAGSNGPYSHSCVVLGGMLNMPCENAGVAVGIGLDDIFARDLKLLHAGDVVYLPMEMQQYVVTRAQNRAAVDAGLLLRHDRRLLGKLPADRIAGAIFCCNLSDFLESLAEMPLAYAGLMAPDQMVAKEYDTQGDRIGTPLANADRTLLPASGRVDPQPAAINAGYGRRLIANFVQQATRRGVIVFGGLPTDFSTALLTPATIAAVAAIYTQHGGTFLALPNHSLYPRNDFFDSEDHLAQPCQYRHSIALAGLIGSALKRNMAPPALAIGEYAETCPTE